METILTIVVIAGSLGAVISALYPALFLRSKGRKREEATIESRITKLTESLREAAGFVTSIENEIKAREALVNKLKKDIKTYEQIKELNSSQVESIAQVLRGELKQEGRRSFWHNFAMNFGFFILGGLVSGLMVAYL